MLSPSDIKPEVERRNTSQGPHPDISGSAVELSITKDGPGGGGPL
jgi:hypothetical protein